MIKKICLSLAAVSGALIAGVAQAADDYLIRIDGISGTSNIAHFEDYIKVESWSLGFSRGVCQSLNFAKQMDAASADLTGATMLGTYYPSIILIALKQGEGRVVTMRLTLTNSVFTSFQTGGSSNSSVLPMESISVQPSVVKFEAFEQDERGNVELVATNTVTCQRVK